MKRVFRSLWRHKALATVAVGIIVLVSAMTVSANHKYDAQQAATALAASKTACTLYPKTFLNTVNQWRAAAHVQPLQYSTQLQQAAQARIADMVQYQYYGHTNPQTNVKSYTVEFQHDPAATNVDEVEDAPNNATQSTVDFKNSLDHFQALINPKYNYLGFEAVYQPEKWASYDNTGKLLTATGINSSNCLVLGELADKVGQAPAKTTAAQAQQTTPPQSSVAYQAFVHSQACYTRGSTDSSILTSAEMTAFSDYEEASDYGLGSPDTVQAAKNAYNQTVTADYTNYVSDMQSANCLASQSPPSLL